MACLSDGRDSLEFITIVNWASLGWALAVAMHRVRRERWQTKRDVFGAARKWSRVADPFAAVRNDGLPGRHIQFAGFMLHPQRAAQDHCVFVKFRRLARLLPAFGTAHVGNADAAGRGVDMPDIFFDDLRLVSGGFDARRMRNQSWHDG